MVDLRTHMMQNERRRAAMLAVIAVIQRQTGLSNRAIGLEIMHDPRWVYDLEAGRAPRGDTFLRQMSQLIELVIASDRGRGQTP